MEPKPPRATPEDDTLGAAGRDGAGDEKLDGLEAVRPAKTWAAGRGGVASVRPAVAMAGVAGRGCPAGTGAA